jgi:hypothetical protein
MTDSNELVALRAALRGAVASDDALSAVSERVESVSSIDDLTTDELDALSRLSAAHAIASAALRGLVNTILARRGREVTR